MKVIHWMWFILFVSSMPAQFVAAQEKDAELKELTNLARNAVTGETDAELKKLIDKLDKLYRANTSFSELEITIVTPHWERSLSVEFWTEGLDKAFIHIKSPKKEKGTAFLRIDKEMWSFFPKINKIMRIPPSMMMSSWMGSDFTNDDLVKESTFLEDYTFKMIHPQNGKPDRVYVEMIPKESTITIWAKIILEAEKDRLIPVQQIYYDEKGDAMRTLDFRDVKEIDGRLIPAVMEVIPLSEKKKGNKTTIIYKSAKFDLKLEKDIFSLRNLQRKR